MRAILIDAYNTQIREVDIDEENLLPSMYAQLKCSTFECAMMMEGGETLYVDEEGLLNGTQVAFEFEGGHQPFMGNGLILGTNEEGESVDTKLTAEGVSKQVTFTSRKALRTEYA